MKIRLVYDSNADPKIIQIAHDMLMLALKLPRGEITRIELIEEMYKLASVGMHIIRRNHVGA